MWHWSGMQIQIISAISANYNCQCGGHRTLAENMREQFSSGNTPSPKSCSAPKEKQSAWVRTAPTHHFKNSLWWMKPFFSPLKHKSGRCPFSSMCTHRPQSNYNLLGGNYSKSDHIFYSHGKRIWFWEIWGKLLLDENIIIYTYECISFWFDKWFKMQHIVSS